jgi:hypothetical protein
MLPLVLYHHWINGLGGSEHGDSWERIFSALKDVATEGDANLFGLALAGTMLNA